MIKHFVFAACFVASLGLSKATQAAEFSILDDHPEGCNIALSGQVTAGDTERLRELTTAPDQNRFIDGAITLCLDSPGGSYLEGLALARHLGHVGIRTHVPAGASCLSACALAFLGGSRLGFEDSIVRTVSRSLHASARLGFHAPQLDLAPGQFNEAQVKSAFGVAIRSSAILFSRLEELNIDQAFALAFFDVPEGTFYEIDTPEHLHALGAKVTGLTRLPERLTPERMAQICALQFPEFDPASYADPDIYTAVARTAHQPLPPRRSGQQRSAYLFATTAEGTVMWDACEVTWTPQGQPGGPDLRVRHYILEDLDFLDYQNPTPPTEAQVLARLPNESWGGTDLSPTLAAPAGTALAQLAETTPRAPKDLLAISCAPVHESYRVVRVQTFSNMRAAPGFDAGVVAEIPKDALVTPVAHDFGATAIADACQAVCQPSAAGRLTPDQTWQIQTCRASNDVWWQVRAANGATGWMSSKYLAQ